MHWTRCKIIKLKRIWMRIVDLYLRVKETIKTKGEMSRWGHLVDEILGMGTLWNKMFFSKLAVSKWNVWYANNVVKMMVPHDCLALLENKIIVTKTTSLVIIVHLCSNVRWASLTTNIKDNDESNVLFMQRKKKNEGE